MELIDHRKLKGAVLVSQDGRGIVISVREAGLFESGVESMTLTSWSILEGIGQILMSLPNQVRVEGHSDNQNVQGKFPSNWELSAARATSVLRWFIDRYHLDPQRFSAVGYGEFRPIAGNDTPEGRLRNRRVDIVILSEEAASKEAPIRRRVHREAMKD